MSRLKILSDFVEDVVKRMFNENVSRLSLSKGERWEMQKLMVKYTKTHNPCPDQRQESSSIIISVSSF